MRTKITLLVATLSVFITHSAFALQTLSVADNTGATAKIALNELNRIFIENDRIKNVKGSEGQYTLNFDNQNGQVYLKPLPNINKHPITLFLQTESGKNLQLLLKPTAKTAETIRLKLMGNHRPKALRWETASPYEQTLVQLIQIMLQDKDLDGYEVIPIKKFNFQKLSSKATIALQQTYLGEHLRGEVFLFKNTSSCSIRLTEKQFFRPNTRAIAIEEAIVPSQGVTRIFMVMRHE